MQAALSKHLEEADRLVRLIRDDPRNKYNKQRVIRVELKIKEARLFNGDV